MPWGPDMRSFARVGAPSLALPFKGVKRRACEPLARAPLNARSRMRSAGLLGEARMAELGNVGWGWVCSTDRQFLARHFGTRRNPVPLISSYKAELPLGLRPSALLFVIAQKVTKKARHRMRCSDSPRANRNPLRFSARRGCSDSTSMYCFAIAAIHRRDPAGFLPPRLRCSAPRTAPLILESVHPWTASRRFLCFRQTSRKSGAEHHA
jgi:hypothetical protein